ncbi:MAG TPA: hypothetical protein VGQ52_08885 [Gemmatimonadaceae bacterium]|nr:hypothetical protein [Gemmatimonadaceae bacterium]
MSVFKSVNGNDLFGSSGLVGWDRIEFVTASAVHRLWPTTSEAFVLLQKQKRSCAAHVLMLSFLSGARSVRSARFVPSEEQLLFQIVNRKKICVAQAAMSGRRRIRFVGPCSATSWPTPTVIVNPEIPSRAFF